MAEMEDGIDPQKQVQIKRSGESITVTQPSTGTEYHQKFYDTRTEGKRTLLDLLGRVAKSGHERYQSILERIASGRSQAEQSTPQPVSPDAPTQK